MTFSAACPLGYTLEQKALARHRATAVFEYLTGAPATVLAGDPKLADAAVLNAAAVLRSEMTGATQMYVPRTVRHPAPLVSTAGVMYTDSAVRPTMYLAGSSPANHATLRTRISRLGNAVSSALGPFDGPCANEYLLPGGGSDVTSDKAAGVQPFAIDPEPATLTGALANALGVTAGAVTPTQIVEWALRWPDTYTALTSYPVVGGQPCSPVAAPVGTVLTSRIVIRLNSAGVATYAKCAPM